MFKMLIDIIAVSFFVSALVAAYRFNKRNKKKKTLKEQYDTVYFLLKDLHNAEDMSDILEIHQDAIDADISQYALIDPYYFRGDCYNLTLDDIYLGNIYGLWTKTATYWMSCEEKMGSNSWGIDENEYIRDVITKQYKNIILRALESERMKLFGELKDYE